MNRRYLRIGAVALGGTIVVLTNQQLSIPVIAVGNKYKYVIGKPRLTGINDNADNERRALKRILESKPIKEVENVEIEIADSCESRDCDVVDIVETVDLKFKVNFSPKVAELQNKNHLEQETRRQPYDDPRLIWQEGAKEIADMIVRHQSFHTLVIKSTP